MLQGRETSPMNEVGGPNVPTSFKLPVDVVQPPPDDERSNCERFAYKWVRQGFELMAAK